MGAVTTRSGEGPARPEHDVIVIGAGFSGIGMGIRLKKAGIHSFVILEKADDLGGTWRDNTYPGIAVDISSFTYSYSFEPNPRWSRVFAPGAELLAYARHCAETYGVRPHMRFGVDVEKIVFDEANHLWRVHAKNGAVLTGRFLVSATGGLTQPKKPDIPGVDDFRGKSMHTARWDHGYDLRGKRVAVIGTGATAVQLVPSIAPIVARMYVYQRTPIWILPKPDRAIPPWMSEAFARVPATQRAVRYVTTAATEAVMVIGVVYNKQTPWLIRGIENLAMRHLEEQVPDPELRAKLTPRYGFGCKRPSVSNEYLSTFTKPHVELVTDPIERVSARGVVTRDGREREVDVLILATGFKVFEKGNLPAYDAYGIDGVELGRFWAEQRFQAYEGATVPGFPNFFTILGPYGTSGASWFAMVEAQTTHALRCIREARTRGATRVEIRKEPHEAYFREVLRRQKNTVFFNNGCTTANSYYFDHHGDAPFLRPSSGLEMHWHANHFPLEHYRFDSLT